MIPLVGNRTVTASSFRDVANRVDRLTVTNRLPIGGNRTRLELLIHRQHIAAHRLRPVVAALVLRLTGEGVRARLRAVTLGREAGGRRVRNRLCDIVVRMVPLVLHRQLAALSRRVRDGIDLVISRTVTHLLMSIIGIDGAGVELVTHRNGYIIVGCGCTTSHRGRYQYVIGRGGRERSYVQRLTGIDYRRVIIFRPRIAQSVFGSSVGRQRDRSAVTNRLILDVLQRYLRVIHRNGNLLGLHRRGTGKIVHRLHGIDLHGVGGGLLWCHHVVGRSSRLKHNIALLPRLGVRVFRIRCGVGRQFHRHALTNRGIGDFSVVTIII